MQTPDEAVEQNDLYFDKNELDEGEVALTNTSFDYYEYGLWLNEVKKELVDAMADWFMQSQLLNAMADCVSEEAVDNYRLEWFKAYISPKFVEWTFFSDNWTWWWSWGTTDVEWFTRFWLRTIDLYNLCVLKLLPLLEYTVY